MHLTHRLILDNFYLIYFCDKAKFRLFLNHSNAELSKKFMEINRNKVLTNKFTLAVESIKNNQANRSQWNWEDSCSLGEIHAIKVDNYRFYTLVQKNGGYRELFMCRYGRKQSQSNDKALKDTISSISNIIIQKQLS